MPTVRQRVEQQLRTGDLVTASPLLNVPSVGTYIAKRAARALGVNGRLATVGDLWTVTRGRVGAGELIRKIVQNDRSNQCVSTRIAESRRRSYHTGDMNTRGYEAFATLLNYARNHIHPSTMYPAIPYRLSVRSDGSKHCSCHTLRECDISTKCTRSDDMRTCLPVAHNARGFEGIRTRTNQRESNTDVTHVRRASRMRIAAAHRNDPDTQRDIRNRRSRTLSYARRGRHLWRRPGSRVREPL